MEFLGNVGPGLLVFLRNGCAYRSLDSLWTVLLLRFHIVLWFCLLLCHFLLLFLLLCLRFLGALSVSILQ